MTATLPTAPQLRFFEAGLDLLAEEGYGALKLAPLCRRVGVTTGSFYHAFPNWPTYTSALLQHWYRERTDRARVLADEETDPARRVELLVRAAVELPHRAEAAIRVWAGVDPGVAQLQQQVDDQRLATVTEALAAAMPPGSEDLARNLAQAGFFLLVGYEQSHATGGREALEWALRLIQDRALDAGGESQELTTFPGQPGNRPL
ncbi:TetR/AcrR family transcriptional regulator [Nocardioides zeae]|uniref:TetR/AcrR family transcriptional regulator n=1 Tax=Nocardioides zeae TaxID=1457234 RepID=A0A6P0HKA0_9ACTN|nr:TetR/AcrR family transcriptional regulator [Nocardioides zeae]NEN79108.1 TetR/AcrR family transcriptional regulator [Nocardioides zeae]